MGTFLSPDETWAWWKLSLGQAAVMLGQPGDGGASNEPAQFQGRRRSCSANRAQISSEWETMWIEGGNLLTSHVTIQKEVMKLFMHMIDWITLDGVAIFLSFLHVLELDKDATIFCGCKIWRKINAPFFSLLHYLWIVIEPASFLDLSDLIISITVFPWTNGFIPNVCVMIWFSPSI